jgi:hypothetical protein
MPEVTPKIEPISIDVAVAKAMVIRGAGTILEPWYCEITLDSPGGGVRIHGRGSTPGMALDSMLRTAEQEGLLYG